MEDHGDGIILKRKDGSTLLCTDTVETMDFIHLFLHHLLVTVHCRCRLIHSNIGTQPLAMFLLQHYDILTYSKMVISIPKGKFHCESCILAKSKHSVPGQSECKTITPFELIHSDISGRFPVKSIDGTIIHILVSLVI